MKRPLLAVTAVVAAVGLSSCDAVGGSTQDAATVGSGSVTVDQLQSVMRALSDVAVREGQPGVDAATGTIDGATARRYLTAMIQGEANEQFLAAHGEQISDADRESARATAGIPPGLPADVSRVIEDSVAAGPARARIKAPSAAELEQRYEVRPSDLGVVCIRQVVLASEGEAQDVADQIDGGAKIEDLATARSIDATTKAKGGAVEAQDGSTCLPAYSTAGVVDDAVVAALVDAAPGDVVGPVRGNGGWYVVQARPYGEIAEGLASLYAQAAGDLQFYGFLTHADVSVRPSYGRWDRATVSVTSLDPTAR